MKSNVMKDTRNEWFSLVNTLVNIRRLWFLQWCTHQESNG